MTLAPHDVDVLLPGGGFGLGDRRLDAAGDKGGGALALHHHLVGTVGEHNTGIW